MVVGVMPLLVLVAFAPMEMQGLGAGPFDPLLSTADIPRLLPDAWMVRLNVLILITSFCSAICLFDRAGLFKNVFNKTPVIIPEK